MASSNVSNVYISVIDDVISKVREDFITYGVGDAVLNELQAVSTAYLSTPGCAALESLFVFCYFDGCFSDPAREILALGDEDVTLRRNLGKHRPHQDRRRVRRRHRWIDPSSARP